MALIAPMLCNYCRHRDDVVVETRIGKLIIVNKIYVKIYTLKRLYTHTLDRSIIGDNFPLRHKKQKQHESTRHFHSYCMKRKKKIKHRDKQVYTNTPNKQ